MTSDVNGELAVIPDLSALLDAVQERGTEHAFASAVHGPRHWRDVSRIGGALCAHVPAADRELVFLFGMLHDCCRLNDIIDPEHGPRASVVAAGLIDDGLIVLAGERARLLCAAIHDHTAAGRLDEPTMGICLDSDRLSLWRVPMTPNPKYLSSAPARTAAAPEFSKALLAGPDRDWSEIYDAVLAGRPLDKLTLA